MESYASCGKKSSFKGANPEKIQQKPEKYFGICGAL
jgi:hypothetical protein